MTAFNLSKITVTVTMMGALTVQAGAQSTNATNRMIVVSLEDRKLTLSEDGWARMAFLSRK